MKKLLILFAVAIFCTVLLCGCGTQMTNDAKKETTPTISKTDPTTYSNDNNGLLDDVTSAVTSETVDNTDGIMTEEGNLDSMIDDGRVEDGDGNVGDLENRDYDPNTDVNAAEYAQEQVSPHNED